MGRDKAFLQLAPDGPPMIAIVIEKLRALSDDVLIVSNDPDRFATCAARVVPDLKPGLGTLAGIQAAVHHAEHQHCFVVACDLPFLNLSLVDMMVNQERDYDVLAPRLPGRSRQGDTGFVYQTLHAIYSKSCLPPIALQLHAGNLQVIGFFGDVHVREISIDDVRAIDPELWSFFNVNTPEALDLARDIASKVEHFPAASRSSR